MSVKLILANKSNKQAMDDWEEFLQSIRDSTPIDINETEEEKQKRIKYLEKPGNEEEWFAYYFPKYCFSAPAAFHKKSTKAFLKADRIYHSRKWARGLSKSTRRMFELFYKKFVQKIRLNMLLISKTETNAIRLLAPYRANLESNQRLINDYGPQRRVGKWSDYEFQTKDKCSFIALGIEQSPRGAKLEELRVNVLVFDDADDDEVCRNEERLETQWKWIERAAIPTVDISADYWICFDNNVIAEDCLALRAAEKATLKETINIRDENNRSVWPEKNSEEDIDFIESTISYESFQQEYMNNPMSQGKTFKEMKWGKCPPMKKLQFVVVYADPATSNKDKPTVKSRANNSAKVVAIMGVLNNVYYVYKAFLDNTSNANFIEWFYRCREIIGVQTTAYYVIENNKLQDPFYEQVFLPGFKSKAEELNVSQILITPDTREKPDKWVRIEANLEPVVRQGKFVLNIDEKDDKHMQRLEKQFLNAKPTSKNLDGPDCCEGGKFIIDQKITFINHGADMEAIELPINSKRF